jgi:cytidylate kinase
MKRLKVCTYSARHDRALFGFSCTGKTTLGQHLSEALVLPFRSCGEAVRDRARMLGIAFQDLSYREHRIVDDDTREWVRNNRPCVVEGRYLDYVLAPLRRDVVIIRLEASNEDRSRREEMKSGLAAKNLDDQTKADLAFANHMYSMGEQLAPSLVLNSSEFPVETCVQRIISLIDSHRAQLG